jgi:hypothetical protein
VTGTDAFIRKRLSELDARRREKLRVSSVSAGIKYLAHQDSRGKDGGRNQRNPYTERPPRVSRVLLHKIRLFLPRPADFGEEPVSSGAPFIRTLAQLQLLKILGIDR